MDDAALAGMGLGAPAGGVAGALKSTDYLPDAWADSHPIADTFGLNPYT